MVAAEVMDGAVVRRWCRLAAEALGQTRSAIDALNVYPVPDADTGTNLYRTLRSATEAVESLPAAAGPAAVWQAVADGAMLGACGNSGIIVSQLLRGLADVCAPAVPCDGSVVARALGHAAQLARAAVSRPAEGTVLTVADAAAKAVAEAAAAETTGPALGVVVLAAAAAARRALGLTTGQLAALAASGVVDAGAAGLCVILDALAAAVSGTSPERFDVPSPGARVVGRAGRAEAGAARTGATEAGTAAAAELASCGYEVTYLLAAPAGQVTELREQLDSMGDSLVIAGGPGPSSAGLWSVHVHVHVPEAGAAIEAGLRAGRLRRITVTYLGAPRAAGHRVLAVCDTAGMAALAESAGAQVLRSGWSGFPSGDELSAVIRRLARRCIIVPNGPEARIAAAAAAVSLRTEGIEVRIVDVRSPVQALPALAVHEPQAEFDADADAMDRAAARMRTVPQTPGQQTPGQQTAGPQTAGQQTAAALTMTDELLAGGAVELMTFLTGPDAPADLGELAMAHVREVSPGTEIECHAIAPAGTVLLAGAE